MQVGGQASHGINRESLLDLISLVNTLRGRSLYRSNGQMPPGPPASVNHPAVTEIPRPLPLQKLREGYAFPTAVSTSMSAPLPGDGPHVGYHQTMDPVHRQTRREATVRAGLASRSIPTVPTTVSYAEARLPHLPPHQTSALHPHYDIYSGHVSANPSHPRIVDMNVGQPFVQGADVYIGGNVRILPGCIIGQGSTIAANSVVTRVSDSWPKHTQLMKAHQVACNGIERSSIYYCIRKASSNPGLSACPGIMNHFVLGDSLVQMVKGKVAAGSLALPRSDGTGPGALSSW